MIVANEPRRRRVFVAGSLPDAVQLRKAVREPNLDVVTLDEAATPGTSWVESLHRCLDDADMVIGIVGDRSQDRNVLFEMGVASGLNKPAILFVAPDYPAEHIPPSGLPYLRIDLRDEDSLRFGLKQMLSLEPRDRSRTASAGFTTCPIGASADHFLATLAQATSEEFELLIRMVIEATGAITLARGRDFEGDGVDLTVWSNDFEPTVATPLLIVSRLQLDSQTVVDAAIGQISRALAPIRNSYGLVLYRDLYQPEPITGSLAMAFVSAADFIENLRSRGLAEYVRKLRNASGRGS